MTRYEKAKEAMIQLNCPADFRAGPMADFNTAIWPHKDGPLLGCRGISCEQCWNAEYEEVRK